MESQFPNTVENNNIFEQIAGFLNLIKSNVILLSISFFTPIAVAFIFVYFNPPDYRARMIARVNFITSNETNYFVQSLQDLITSSDYRSLGKLLAMKEKNVRSLREIKYVRVRDKTEGFLISVEVNDTTILRPLEKGLEYFMESNPYLKDKIFTKKETLENQLKYLNKEIRTLDSIKVEIEKTGYLNALEMPYYQSSIYVQLVSLRDKRSEVSEKLNDLNGFVIIKGFSIPERPQNGSAKKYLVLGILGGMICCFLAIKWIEYVRKANRISTNS